MANLDEVQVQIGVDLTKLQRDLQQAENMVRASSSKIAQASSGSYTTGGYPVGSSSFLSSLAGGYAGSLIGKGAGTGSSSYDAAARLRLSRSADAQMKGLTSGAFSPDNQLLTNLSFIRSQLGPSTRALEEVSQKAVKASNSFNLLNQTLKATAYLTAVRGGLKGLEEGLLATDKTGGKLTASVWAATFGGALKSLPLVGDIYEGVSNISGYTSGSDIKAKRAEEDKQAKALGDIRRKNLQLQKQDFNEYFVNQQKKLAAIREETRQSRLGETSESFQLRDAAEKNFHFVSDLINEAVGEGLKKATDRDGRIRMLNLANQFGQAVKDNFDEAIRKANDLQAQEERERLRPIIEERSRARIAQIEFDKKAAVDLKEFKKKLDEQDKQNKLNNKDLDRQIEIERLRATGNDIQADLDQIAANFARQMREAWDNGNVAGFNKLRELRDLQQQNFIDNRRRQLMENQGAGAEAFVVRGFGGINRFGLGRSKEELKELENINKAQLRLWERGVPAVLGR